MRVRSRRQPRRARTVVCAALGSVLALPLADGAGELNLYEWLAVAPVVVIAENLATHGKYAEFRVDHTLRGAGDGEPIIHVAVRRANRDRDREIVKQPLKFDKGLSYLLLLAPSPKGRPSRPTFELVRGPRGAREIPPEGRQAFVEAARRFVRMQDLNDDRHTWSRFRAMLDETNPLLIEIALEQFLKFDRGDVELLNSLRPLLDHPSQTTRERTARLIGQILDGADAERVPDVALLRNELVGKARRDSAVPVRVAATEALDGLAGYAIDEVLEEIARDDPHQLVRYTAERLIYDRRRQGNGPAGRSPTDGPD